MCAGAGGSRNSAIVRARLESLGGNVGWNISCVCTRWRGVAEAVPLKQVVRTEISQVTVVSSQDA